MLPAIEVRLSPVKNSSSARQPLALSYCLLPGLQRWLLSRRMAAWRRMGHAGPKWAALAELGVALGALGPSDPSATKFVPSAGTSATSMAFLRHSAILRRESAVGRPGLSPERLVFSAGRLRIDQRASSGARPAKLQWTAGASPWKS